MRPVRTMAFRDRTFQVQEGTTHPAYSINCFLDDEADFRRSYWRPRASQTVVDVGASYGAYTLTALAMGARVIAFEPEPTVVKDLRTNVDLNRFTDCYVSDRALWDCESVIDFRTLAPHWPQQTITSLYETTTLDRYALNRVDWLKIDVEGSEVRVLQGATETLRVCHPVVIVESHVFMDPTLTEQCKQVLRFCGYNAFKVLQRDPCEFLLAERHIITGE